VFKPKIKYAWITLEYLAWTFLIYKTLNASNIYIERYLGLYEVFLYMLIATNIIITFCVIGNFEKFTNQKDIESFRKKQLKNSFFKYYQYFDDTMTFGLGMVVWVLFSNKSLSIALLVIPFSSHWLIIMYKYGLKNISKSESPVKAEVDSGGLDPSNFK